MKKNVLLSAIVTSFCALSLYAAAIRQQASGKLTVLGESNTNQKVSSGQASRLPEATRLRIRENSNLKLAKVMVKPLTQKTARYQVEAAEISPSTKVSAQVTNTTKTTFSAGNILQLYVLLAYYESEKNGQIKGQETYQVKTSDLIKGETRFTAQTTYSYTYIVQQMMQNSVTASNILFNKVTAARMNRVARQYGASVTKITGKFGSANVGTTNADDLMRTMKALYMGKGLGTRIDNKVLGLLATYPKKQLGQQVSGTRYHISDANHDVTLFQSNGKTIVMVAATEGLGSQLPEVGQQIGQWFSKN